MIGKAGLDGSNPTKLVHNDLGWVNGLALDFQARRVYWVDSKLDRVEYVGFDGDGRRILIQNSPKVHHPFGIALHQVMRKEKLLIIQNNLVQPCPNRWLWQICGLKSQFFSTNEAAN